MVIWDKHCGLISCWCFFKTERLRRASVRQARNVNLLRETINVKDTQIGKLREDNAKLRRMLKVRDK